MMRSVKYAVSMVALAALVCPQVSRAEDAGRVLGWGQDSAGLSASVSSDNDKYGSAVAVSPSSDRVIVGAKGASTETAADSGAVFVFVRGADTGRWSQEAVITAPAPAEAMGFGASVAMDDNLVIGSAQGSVHVFRLEGGSWVQKAELTGTESDPFDGSGDAVATRGDFILAGAYKNSRSGVEAGAATVFERIRGAENWWAERRVVRPGGLQAGDQFGKSVALDGTHMVVGAPGDSSGVGAVYVFNYGGALTAKVTPTAGAIGDGFGWSIAVSGSSLAVGAFGADRAGIDSGAVTVYTLQPDGATWGAPQALSAGSAPGDGFGGSLALEGPHLAVGSVFGDKAGELDTGRVDVFVRGAETGQWAHEKAFFPPGGEAGMLYGRQVGMGGTLVAVGSTADHGRVYLVEGIQTTAPLVSVDANSQLEVKRGKDPESKKIPLTLMLAIVLGVVGGIVGLFLAVACAMRRRGERLPEYLQKVGVGQVAPTRPGDDLYRDGGGDMQPMFSCGDLCGSSSGEPPPAGLVDEAGEGGLAMGGGDVENPGAGGGKRKGKAPAASTSSSYAA